MTNARQNHVRPALGALLAFARFPRARLAASIAAVIALAWLAVQVSIIGYVSWMQPATTLAAVIVLVLARFLPSV